MDVRDWVEKTTAGDLMVREVVTLDPSDVLAQAASVLLRERISGAPVVDEAGTCVGVLSASDIIGAEEKVAEERQEVAESSFFNFNLALPMSVYADKLEQVRDKLAPAAEQVVERFMTSEVVTVDENTALRSVLHQMVDSHVHRVVVLDATRRLFGIISTTDVLAALLRAGS